MFRFEHTTFLYALALIPVLLLLFWLARRARQRAMERFGHTDVLQRLMPQVSRYKHGLKFGLLLLALTFLVVGLANPQWGTKKEKVKRKSVDVFIALDISRSMLAEDIAPSRLERAQRFAQEVVEKLRGERIGLIIFAGNAYLQVPLTTDYAAVNLFLRSANPDMAPSQGTAIVDAIELAGQSFQEDNKSHKALIILSDGENHDSEAVDAARRARNNGMLVFTLGVGTPEGSFIPVSYNGRQDYKRDQSGNPVLSQLNEDMLEQIARSGDGRYFNINSSSDAILSALQQQIDNIEKRELEQQLFEDYNSYFQYFLLVALLLILAEFLISYRKNDYFAQKDLFKE